MLSDTPEQAVKRCPAGALGKKRLKSRGQRLCFLRRWRGLVGLEIGIVELLAKLPRCELLRRSIRSPGAIFVASEACPAERLT